MKRFSRMNYKVKYNNNKRMKYNNNNNIECIFLNIIKS